jgi:hypothetical protein
MAFGKKRDDTHVKKGPGLARGPALILGSILLAFPLLAMPFLGDQGFDFPGSGNFTDGTAQGDRFLGFEMNGWTLLLTAAAGGLLLFGAAQHLLAKIISLIVGLALGAASVISLVDGDDVLGLAAANGWTKLAWGIASALLLFNTLMPRVKHKEHDRTADVGHDTRRVATPPVPVERHREREVVAEPREATRRDVVDTPRETTHREVVDTTPDRDYDREVVAPASDGVRTRDAGLQDRSGRFEREPERTRITDDVRQSERTRITDDVRESARTSGPGSTRDDRLS